MYISPGYRYLPLGHEILVNLINAELENILRFKSVEILAGLVAKEKQAILTLF